MCKENNNCSCGCKINESISSELKPRIYPIHDLPGPELKKLKAHPDSILKFNQGMGSYAPVWLLVASEIKYNYQKDLKTQLYLKKIAKFYRADQDMIIDLRGFDKDKIDKLFHEIAKGDTDATVAGDYKNYPHKSLRNDQDKIDETNDSIEKKLNRLREILKKIVIENLKEMSSTGTGASFSAGQGEQYSTPLAFSKTRDKVNRATQYLIKQGYTRPQNKSRFGAKTFDIERWY